MKPGRIPWLKQRLAIHKRRMKYWACLPGFYGPSGKTISMASRMYELACDDALNISEQITRYTGNSCRVVDIKRTFQVRFSNPKAKEIFL